MNNGYFKMSNEELQSYLQGKRNRAFAKKKGRGSYTRKAKHKVEEEN